MNPRIQIHFRPVRSFLPIADLCERFERKVEYTDSDDEVGSTIGDSESSGDESSSEGDNNLSDDLDVDYEEEEDKVESS